MMCRRITAELLAPTTDPLAASDGVVVIPDGSVETSSPSSYDLVVVPAGADTPETRSFIKEVYSSGGAVLSVCTGAGLDRARPLSIVVCVCPLRV